MTRVAFALLLLIATNVSAAEKWFESYDRGVAAVNARNYKAAADSLQKAIAEMPTEGTNVRAKNSLITYVPHFWLGIAKFNLGDVDGALREWRTSEEQGVLARTQYYAQMQDWVARAQTEKQRNAQSAASAPKKAADIAISKALEMQLEALSAGGDRAEKYLAAQRKLLDARTQFQKAGTDVTAYRGAEQTAQQAASLFASAADEGRKQKAARAAAPPPVKKKIEPVLAPPMREAVAGGAAGFSPPKPEHDGGLKAAAPQVPVITQAEVEKRIAEQEAKKKEMETGRQAIPPVAVAVTPKKETGQAGSPLLQAAYRAFASGDLLASEKQLSKLIASQPAAEAYLLRGCARYTRAMLSRTPDRLLASAADDFRAALARNRALRLDDAAFSPKLVAYFESIRRR
jgi:hypothetical protein